MTRGFQAPAAAAHAPLSRCRNVSNRQIPVATDTFSLTQESEIGHIHLADSADLFVIAPATANIIGKIANGIADGDKYPESVDELGIAKTARDEKLQARKQKTRTPEEQKYDAEMARLYRQHVLKEDPNLVSIGSLRASLKKAETDVEVRG